MDLMNSKLLSIAALGAVLALGACSDNNSPNGGDLSSQEQAALIQALSAKGIVAPSAVVGLTSVLGQGTVGSMGKLTALGSQIKITTNDGGTSQTTVLSSITGWAGLNTGAKSVDSALTVATIEENASTFPSTFTTDFSTDNGFAAYYNGTTTFSSDPVGAFNLTSSSFGTTQNCPSIPAGSQITSCRVATGTMTGNFDFTVKDASNNPYTRANTSFSVPAVQLSITVDLTQQN